VHLPENFAES
jgi:hypothetical protein